MDLKTSMNRKEFLMKIGVGGGALLAVLSAGCLSGCSTQNVVNQPTGNVNFSLDLTASSNAALKTNGGYVISNQVVVAKTTSGSYVAVTQQCSHQGQLGVTFLGSSNEFYCNVHGALYDTNGKGLNSLGSNGLTVYKISLSGNTLTISS